MLIIYFPLNIQMTIKQLHRKHYSSLSTNTFRYEFTDNAEGQLINVKRLAKDSGKLFRVRRLCGKRKPYNLSLYHTGYEVI